MYEFDWIDSAIEQTISHQLWCSGVNNYIHYTPSLCIEFLDDHTFYTIQLDYVRRKIYLVKSSMPLLYHHQQNAVEVETTQVPMQALESLPSLI